MGGGARCEATGPSVGPAPFLGLVHQRARAEVLRSDRAWFAAHPGAAERVRPAIDHEFCPLDTECLPVAAGATVVRELVPGVRSRFPVEMGR